MQKAPSLSSSPPKSVRTRLAIWSATSKTGLIQGSLPVRCPTCGTRSMPTAPPALVKTATQPCASATRQKGLHSANASYSARPTLRTHQCRHAAGATGAASCSPTTSWSSTRRTACQPSPPTTSASTSSSFSPDRALKRIYNPRTGRGAIKRLGQKWDHDAIDDALFATENSSKASPTRS